MNKYLAEELADDIFKATFPSWIIRLRHLLGNDIRKADNKNPNSSNWGCQDVS